MKLEALQRLFDAQHQLALKFAPNEIANGYTPPTSFPMDLNKRATQDRLRAFAWHIVEEIVEATVCGDDEFPDELSDILHFTIEICLIAGVPPAQIVQVNEVDMFFDGSSPALLDVIVQVGLALNECKAKPWKLSPRLPQVGVVHYHLAKALCVLLRHIEAAGLSPESIYFKKAKINEQRIADGV